MVQKDSSYIKVNEKHVVHETIEGETILLHLATGNYYSIKWPGTTIWNLLCQTGDAGSIKEALRELKPSKTDDISLHVDRFVNNLLEEELVARSAEQLQDLEKADQELLEDLKKVSDDIEKLKLAKYTDMQDMLLLDPIHDVDEKGWPEPKKKKK